MKDSEIDNLLQKHLKEESAPTEIKQRVWSRLKDSMEVERAQSSRFLWQTAIAASLFILAFFALVQPDSRPIEGELVSLDSLVAWERAVDETKLFESDYDVFLDAEIENF